MDHNLIDDVTRRWDRFLKTAHLRDDARQVLQQLLRAYTAQDRRYHNLAHIHHCLVELDTVRADCPEPLAVEAAIWFHDAVYDPPSSVNEEKSAQLADRELAGMGLPGPQVPLIHELILDTRHQDTPRTPAGQFMTDIDLSSMGGAFDRFESDGRNIRTEYHHVDDVTFNTNRAAFFERLLARPSLYYTQVFRDRYEAAARDNIRQSLARLKSA